MASLALVHAQWSTPLHHNRNKQVAVLRRKGIILSSTSHRFPAAFQRSPQRRPSCRFPIGAQKRGNGDAAATHEENQLARIVLQSSLWAAEAVYILWLFFLPKFGVVGIHVIEAPVLHPMAEGLFNLVIGWTFLFAPLLFTDHRRGRFSGSLDLLWGFQMFLTNTFLIPYMAIRLNNRSDNTDQSPPKSSQLGLLMTKGARSVGLIGGIVCFVSIIWAFLGRPESGFGDFAGRWWFLEHYIRSERLAYAFIWDIILYAVFQPWLIGDNLQNVRMSDQDLVNVLRYMPVVGLVAYLLCLDDD